MAGNVPAAWRRRGGHNRSLEPQTVNSTQKVIRSYTPACAKPRVSSSLFWYLFQIVADFCSLTIDGKQNISTNTSTVKKHLALLSKKTFLRFPTIPIGFINIWITINLSIIYLSQSRFRALTP